MSTLYITRGLPGCGKTCMASAWVAEDPEKRARINRDDLRAMVHDSVYIAGVTEPRILTARDAAISALLRKGVDVVCDDTNLPNRTVRDLARVARRAGADFEVWDLTHRSVDECIARDAARERPVGGDVIRGMHTRYLKGRPYPLPLPEEPGDDNAVKPYKAKPGTPKAVLVDIDGTAALMGDRSPFDETRVGDDRPNLPVIAVIRALHAAGNRVVFMSGRSDACRAATEEWLTAHVGLAYDALHMREAGDHRKDSIVKAELFDAHVRDVYDVSCVLDDRRQVVEMWRAMGLTVLQVADGDF
ncbi:phosphatase domain-containing protein [Nonomuraea wenchangensis]|uniref:Predicted kinase n=1 Tax=Nonomuraea wenchangensis TaxID=568860 RepID=A0A1I0F4M8_9ACTN|nr:AAA family ATPase [Nonomuraea wenchangensis]SET52002.1 Predicted kinase [Nonomuraea wenchangensis]